MKYQREYMVNDFITAYRPRFWGIFTLVLLTVVDSVIVQVFFAPSKAYPLNSWVGWSHLALTCLVYYFAKTVKEATEIWANIREYAQNFWLYVVVMSIATGILAMFFNQALPTENIWIRLVSGGILGLAFYLTPAMCIFTLRLHYYRA
jgi:hypothetical protein